LATPLHEDFDRADLGANWLDTGGSYTLEAGKLWAQNGYNHPLWLRKRLPADVSIELDVMSKSPDGDIKIELFGDGASFDRDKGGYTSSGYVLIFGGWRNSLSVICKGDEHGEGRKAERGDLRVVPDKTYHWSVVRKGGLIDWKIDGQAFLSWQDPAPLSGKEHAYLAFNDWETRVAFDNLVVKPVTP
jgi:hypothetical protein